MQTGPWGPPSPRGPHGGTARTVPLHLPLRLTGHLMIPREPMGRPHLLRPMRAPPQGAHHRGKGAPGGHWIAIPLSLPSLLMGWDIAAAALFASRGPAGDEEGGPQSCCTPAAPSVTQ